MRRFKVYGKFLLGLFCISLIPPAAFTSVTYYYDLSREKNSLITAVARGEKRINALLSSAEATLSDVAKYVDPTDPEASDLLQREVYNEPLFREIGIIDGNGYLTMTNLGKLDSPIFIEPERRANLNDENLQILGPLKTSLMQEKSLILTLPVVERGEINVLVDPSILTADWGSSIQEDLGPEGYFAYINQKTGEILSSLGELPSQQLPLTNRNASFIQSVVTSQNAQVLVVGGISKASILRQWRDQLLIVIPISSFCSALTIFLALRLMKQSMALDHELRIGLKNQEFIVHYQPIVNLKTGQYVGAEALIRWHHPQQGILSPNMFIPIAERTGLITLIGEWLIKTTSQELSNLFQEFSDLYISVNLSPIQVRSRSLDKVILWLRDNVFFSPARCVFEITEAVIVHNYGTTSSDTLARLRQLGARISLDDFGTGYSGLNYLHQFEVDQIKIDRFYVAAINRDPLITHILETLIDLGQKLDVTLVAEGIETEEQRKFLSERGVEYGQGWLFARPTPIGEFEAAIHRNQPQQGSKTES
ncbi:MAG: EAL domain-containing protein [Cyanobacteria bacterium P01_H01_bin.15]